jgi:hypothetical protein
MGGDGVTGYKFAVGKIKSFIITLLSLAVVFHAFSASAAEQEVLTMESQGVIDVIRQGFYGFCDVIDISEYEIHKDRLGAIFSAVTKNDPYLFFVNSTLSYFCRADGIVVYVKPSYNMERDEAERALKYCSDSVKEIAEIARRGTGELERALLAHDYLCITFEYDITLKNDDMYDFLRSGRGTCQGYAWTYMAVLRELGIDARYVASDTVNHIWTLVKIEGEWYHSDVTWDDPPLNEGRDGVSRRHFLCSDQKAEQQGHSDWYSQDNTKCMSYKYDNVDFTPLVHTNVIGDADHSYSFTLCDLVAARMMLDGKSNIQIRSCITCADSDSDTVLTCTDVDDLRRRLLDILG